MTNDNDDINLIDYLEILIIRLCTCYIRNY